MSDSNLKIWRSQFFFTHPVHTTYIEGLNAFLHVCPEPSLLIYRRELGLISRKYYRLWLHPVFSVVVVGRECGVPITKRSYSFYKQSLYDGDQFVIMAVITKNNTANTRIHLYRQPATETWRWITAQSGTGKPQLICISMYNITSLTKNWFCHDAHFKHQQAKRWILKRFVGVSQEEQVLNL